MRHRRSGRTARAPAASGLFHAGLRQARHRQHRRHSESDGSVRRRALHGLRYRSGNMLLDYWTETSRVSPMTAAVHGPPGANVRNPCWNPCSVRRIQDAAAQGPPDVNVSTPPGLNGKLPARHSLSRRSGHPGGTDRGDDRRGPREDFGPLDDLYVCGGGSHNAFLLDGSPQTCPAAPSAPPGHWAWIRNMVERYVSPGWQSRRWSRTAWRPAASPAPGIRWCLAEFFPVGQAARSRKRPRNRRLSKPWDFRRQSENLPAPPDSRPWSRLDTENSGGRRAGSPPCCGHGIVLGHVFVEGEAVLEPSSRRP